MFNKENSVTPKDFFLSIGSMVALYVSAVSLIGLLFQYINVLFPGPLQGWVDPYNGTLRGFMASLIVAFPLYLWLTRLINKDTRIQGEKKEGWIRRWLTYLLLFVGGTTIAIDLIVLINSFLGGELTGRILLKVLAVLLVTSLGFFYYYFDLRGLWKEREKDSIMYGIVVTIVVLTSIIGGFFIIGSPHDARLTRFDLQKVSDLQGIQWNIADHFQRTRALPESLEILNDEFSRTVTPIDPEPGKSYEYRVISNLSFELCADFNKNNNTGVVEQTDFSDSLYREMGFEDESWQHGIGRTCFERTIDPSRYPVQGGVPAI